MCKAPVHRIFEPRVAAAGKLSTGRGYPQPSPLCGTFEPCGRPLVHRRVGNRRPVVPDTGFGAPFRSPRTGEAGSDLTPTRPGRIFFMLMPLILPALVCVHPRDVAATANAL